MGKYYAVKKGRMTGIFKDWEECQNSINGYSGAEYKSFFTLIEAQNYLDIYEISKTIENISTKNKKIYHLWTDGSAVLNEKAGYGYILLDDNEKILKEKYGKVDAPFTAPHAELSALINGINYLKTNFVFSKNIEIKIHSDSLYVVNSLTIWGDNRSEEEWKKKDYYDLLYPLYLWIKKHNCTIKHVQAHSGIKWNEKVDKLAKSGRDLN